MRKIISMIQPIIGKEDVEAVVGVLKSGILTTSYGDGPYSKKFEESFAKYVGVKYAVTMSSGTAALHAALLSSDIGPGQEVIVPSFTSVATVEAIVLAGAKPCFVDIDPQTYCMEPTSFSEAITSSTRAVIPVHLYGAMADMEKIMKIAREHDLIVIEDTAHALGAELNGKKAGSFGDFGCFSFSIYSNITTGEGGMVVTNRRESCDALYALRSHGIGKHHSSERLGHNYRMSEMACALGYYQLLKLPRLLETRKKNASTLTTLLEEVSRLELPREPKACKHAWCLYTVRLRGCRAGERNKVVNKLVNSGIEAEVLYPTPVHMMPFYRRKYGYKSRMLPKTESAGRQVFSLPSHPELMGEDLKYIGQKVKKIIR